MLIINNSKKPEDLNNNADDIPNQTIVERFSEIDDHSRYFTVSSVLNKFYGYVISEDLSKILLVLDEEYKQNNEINSDNVIRVLDLEDGEYDFYLEEIYESNLMKKYYTKGRLTYEDTHTAAVYNVVILNDTNLTFTLYPISEDEFQEVVK